MRAAVVTGEVRYWGTARASRSAMGRTPVSKGDETRLASPDIFGTIRAT